MKKIGWRVIPIAIFCLLCFFLWRGLSLDPHHLPSARIGKPLPDFALPELQNPDSTFSAMNFHNQVVFLNVWAS
ncbi:DsbE family thiol:disulfide interchange protein, partial [Legionella pneumophila]